MADKKSASSPDRPDINPDDENVTLTEGELDNLFGGAEVSEVSLESPVDDDLPSLDEPEGDGQPQEDALSDSLPELPSLDLDEDLDIDGAEDEPELPSLDDGLEPAADLDSESAIESRLEDEIPEDLPTPEEVKDIELPDLSSDPADAAETQVGVLENADPADELPTLDDMDLPDLSPNPAEKGAEDLEEVEILDEGKPGAGGEEDETIALSNSELDNILSDVDETQVLELGGPEGDDEVVSVSGEELDSITQDLEPVPPEDEEPAAPTEKDVMADSMNFEAEIMEDAQVQIAKLDDEADSEADEALEPLPDDLPSLDDGLPSEPASEGESSADAPPALEEPSTAPETAFDEIHAIPAPPDLPENDAIPEETLEAIDLDEVHQATRPPETPILEAPVEGWDGRITAQELREAEAKSPTKPSSVPAQRAPRAPRVEDRELYDLLKYLDTLLEKLPEESIREFAESRYYDRYIALVNRLGI
ncbi:MAG: hypothetical protein J0L75_01990 [Spirochaetes bacterium]|nr:hypothetical protein [Spirochaetota bacterium]